MNRQSQLFSGEKVLGKCRELWRQVYRNSRNIGLDVVKLNLNGERHAMYQDKRNIDNDKNNEIKGIITHNETSTGVTNDIKAVAELTRNTERLLVVDAISSLGGLDLQMDNWGIDCVVTGSQKALMAPPGLAYVALSEKAWKACEKSTMPKFYWDYIKYKKGLLKEISNNPPYTPAITTALAQVEALKLIKEEGLGAVFERHKKLALATQAGIKALGLSLLPEQSASSYIITAVKAPENVDIGKIIKSLNNDYDIMITGGQKHLKGKIFRIGHCGYVNGFDLIKTFAALEMAFNANGYKVETGTAVSAVQEELQF